MAVERRPRWQCGLERHRARTSPTSATALRILDAAKRILSERGYSKLTLQAIEEESGEYRALVAYYFGSKQGLVEAIIDSLMESRTRHSASVSARSRSRASAFGR